MYDKDNLCMKFTNVVAISCLNARTLKEYFGFPKKQLCTMTGVMLQLIPCSIIELHYNHSNINLKSHHIIWHHHILSFRSSWMWTDFSGSTLKMTGFHRHATLIFYFSMPQVSFFLSFFPDNIMYIISTCTIFYVSVNGLMDQDLGLVVYTKHEVCGL